jgi:hypothetical protein
MGGTGLEPVALVRASEGQFVTSLYNVPFCGRFCHNHEDTDRHASTPGDSQTGMSLARSWASTALRARAYDAPVAEDFD